MIRQIMKIEIMNREIIKEIIKIKIMIKEIMMIREIMIIKIMR